MKDNLELIAIVFAGKGIWDFLKTIVLTFFVKKKKPCDAMLLAIGRDRLLFLSKKYIARKSIPDDEYESFLEMGEAYIEMKGNSKVKHLFEKANQLPIEIETEE